jgi:hypothetical protein
MGSLSTKPSTYLSNFIIYIATIGDIVDGTDTTHDFNYFSLVYEWPKDVSSNPYLFLMFSFLACSAEVRNICILETIVTWVNL